MRLPLYTFLQNAVTKREIETQIDKVAARFVMLKRQLVRIDNLRIDETIRSADDVSIAVQKIYLERADAEDAIAKAQLLTSLSDKMDVAADDQRVAVDLLRNDEKRRQDEAEGNSAVFKMPETE